jgi:hypothetical protein
MWPRCTIRCSTVLLCRSEQHATNPPHSKTQKQADEQTNKQTIDKQTNQRTNGHAHQHLDVRRVAGLRLLRLLHDVLERAHLVRRELGSEQSHVRLGRRD